MICLVIMSCIQDVGVGESQKGFNNVAAPSFEDLDNVNNAIESVVRCVNTLVNEDSNCTEELQSNERNRESKEVVDEAVSFILSIEPVRDNVEVVDDDDLEIEPRNPKAIFVMLPNIEVNEITKDIASEAVEDTIEASMKVIDEFFVDTDDVDDAEEDDAGSGKTGANHP